MKLNAEQINKIKEIAEEYDFDYAAIGFRSQDVPFELGSIDHVSHIWDTETTPAKTFPVFAFAPSSWLIVTLIITASIAL